MNYPNNYLRFFTGLQIKGNIYLALLFRLGSVMLLFSFCRIGFYFFNYDLFPGINKGDLFTILLGGIRFDLTAVIYTNLLFILLMIIPFEFRFKKWYQAICQWLFLISNGLALAANVSDFIYFRFTGRRTTADVFQQFENEKNMTGLFFRFLWDYWYAVLFWTALLAIMAWLYNRVRIEGPQLKNKIAFYISGLLILPVLIFLMIGGIRGDYRHSTRPITLVDAAKYVKNTRDISIVLNTPFSIYRTLNKTKIKTVNHFSSEKELASVFSPVVPASSAGEMKKLNVVVIILESFSKEFIGFYNRHRENGTYTGYTPFLDSLIGKAKTFQYSFANGRKSIDALPSIVASIPSMGVPYTLSPFSGNKINSLGTILKKEGYATSFFHGAPNGSMGFEAFMNIAGIDQYYGMNEYGNEKDFDGLWGIWDENFLGFTAEAQQNFTEPFLSVFFSASSHHPFIIPKEYQDKFKGGREPILRCIQYTDNALRQYFKKISIYPWFKNTLFVITADHCSSNILFDDSRTSKGRYSIPLIFYRPDNSLTGIDSTIVGQVDVMPSVLGYLGYPKSYIAFGNNVLGKTGKDFYAWNFADETYHFYQNDYLLRFDGQKSVGLYDFKRDTMLSQNLMKQFPDTVAQMEQKIKAIIQQYNNRMVENRLVN